jgi:hypothetical protein
MSEKLEKESRRSVAARAWGALALGVTAYEIACPQGETLSEGVDRLMERSPTSRAIALGAIGVTAAHLANLIPEKFDPFHYALIWKERPESLLE